MIYRLIFTLVIVSLQLNHIMSMKSSLSRFSFRSHSTFRKVSIPNGQLIRSRLSAVDFQKELDEKYFDYHRLEKDIYEWWEASGNFQPNDNDINGKTKRKPFIVSMPPPNVTGYLHMGHAMFVALQDLMIRFQRMRGRSTLWLPGTDHAGIATQLLVERSLQAQGITRQQLGREEFLKKIWEWKDEKGDYIIGQMKRLGASADWTRQKFTLDPDMCIAVTDSFVRLYEKGLIYKGEYLVNWSPNLQTAVSDLEVEYSEEMGNLYYFKYELVREDSIHENTGEVESFIPIATTRPETILGDTAICVHPQDERYIKFIGQKVKVPFTDRLIPVIADEYVDKDFGTGALKITPAHDVNDYELSQRHNLPLINIMNKDASINERGGKYEGMDRFKCREEIWKDLCDSQLAIKKEPHLQRVPRSQRGGEVIEPRISSQWFCKMDNMALRAVNAAKNKEIQFIPGRFEKVWYSWLENIHDWCISRQLWWGHRIPVWYVLASDGKVLANELGKEEFIVASSEEEAYKSAQMRFGSSVQLKQDEDVLDTWFSSGLWPFATVGWQQLALPNGEPDPSKGLPNDYSRFYPSSVMETGYDILFFWVARMVMLGLEFTDKAPFHTIYMHGLVRDGNGQKMSKTKGNVIDPIDTIDKFGCDALRFALISGSTPGQDVPLAMEKIEAMRNFVNKLWNIGKFLQNSLSTISEEERSSLVIPSSGSSSWFPEHRIKALPLAEAFIISKVHELIQDVTNAIEVYDYNEASKKLYQFIWDEFADWFVEASKTRMRDEQQAKVARQVLIYVWDNCLRLLHPFMPFISETLWQLLPHEHSSDKQKSLMASDWPMLRSIDEDASSETQLYVHHNAIDNFSTLQALIRAVRNIRAEYNVEASKKIAANVFIANEVLRKSFETDALILSLLGKIDASQLSISSLDIVPTLSLDENVHLIVEDGVEVYLPLAALIDVDKEIKRLQKQEEKLLKDIQSLESRVNSKGFMEKAPVSMVQEIQQNLRDKAEQLVLVRKSLESLETKKLK